MQMDAEKTEFTECDKRLHIQERNDQGLTLRQQQAVELLALGKTKTEVAAAIGVSRQQLHRWDKNVYFRSAVSMTYAAQWIGNKERLRGLAGKAVAVIENEIDGGNLKAAVELLKIIGMANGKAALTKQGKSVDDLLEIEATDQVDSFLATWDKPATTQEALQREFAYRPKLIQDKLKRLRATSKVPEDEDEEAAPEEEVQ